MCKHRFQTPVANLPVNFVVQNIIAESLSSSEWLCQTCFRGGDRRLELSTERCQDCLESVCHSCSTEHAAHRIQSLLQHTVIEEHPALPSSGKKELFVIRYTHSHRPLYIT